MTGFPKYQKIPSPYRRHFDGPMRNKFIDGQWVSQELEATANLSWLFTEKLDGTNIRVHWDGHKVHFGGRTDDAQIPAALFAYLTDTFQEELFEQKFEETPVTLFGEGVGPKIQSVGHAYGESQRVVLFDVLIGGMWLLRPSVEDVAQALGVGVVPLIMQGTLLDAMAAVRGGLTSEQAIKPMVAEGLVGVTEVGLLDRRGNRLIVKIKAKDFAGTEK